MSNLMDKNLFDRIKVVQYESIPVVKDMECPNCHKSDCNGFLKERANPIGWCDTQLGLMAVFECPKCFTKFRCHISSTGRWNKEAFYMDFALVHCLCNRPAEEEQP